VDFTRPAGSKHPGRPGEDPSLRTTARRRAGIAVSLRSAPSPRPVAAFATVEKAIGRRTTLRALKSARPAGGRQMTAMADTETPWQPTPRPAGGGQHTGSARRPEIRGFTLIEVTVVVFLVGILLLVALPRLPEAPLTDHSRKTSRWLVLKIKDLKQRSVREQNVYSLQVDMDTNRFWVTRADMTEAEKIAAEKDAFRPGGSVRIVDVEFPQLEPATVGRTEIRFYPRGYSERAMIHIDDGDRRYSFRIEPFLSRVRIYETDVGYNRS